MVMKVLHLPVLFLDKTVHLFQHHVSHASNEQKKIFYRISNSYNTKTTISIIFPFRIIEMKIKILECLTSV